MSQMLQAFRQIVQILLSKHLMSISEMIITGILMLHLLLGFGYVLYKLTGKNKTGSA